MSTITSTVIAINHNAPTGADAINLYGTVSGASSLTLPQLVQAVCIKAAAAMEAQSVVKMNTMTSGSSILEEASVWLSKIADGSADWPQAKAFLTGTMEIDGSTLPADLATYDRRMLAANALKNKMDTLVKSQQEEMIDLQTLVNRRDVAYSTSSNSTRAYSNSTSANAANF